MDEVKSRSIQVTEDDDVKWDNRDVGRPWTLAVALVAICTVAAVYFPVLLIIMTLGGLCALTFLHFVSNVSNVEALKQEGWRRIVPSDTNYSSQDELVECQGQCAAYAAALRISHPGSALHGDMSRFVRGMPTDVGLCLSVSMNPERMSVLHNSHSVSDPVESYLDGLSEERLEAYVTRRGGVWKTDVNLVIHSAYGRQVELARSAARGAVPTRSWRTTSGRSLVYGMKSYSCMKPGESFYALGIELSEWLVQMRTELASEVGETVPGQFIAPIRARMGDYRIGVTLNPDTLSTGPPAGPSYSEIQSGLLVCGGEHGARLKVLALLVRGLLASKKRVMIVSNDRSAISLASLSEQSVVAELGRDLVLNPVDAESVPRAEYVSRLLAALQTIAGTDLTSAPELEMALSRTVAVGNTTLADVVMSPQSDSVDQSSETQSNTPLQLNKASQAGIDAIRTLYQGSGARAFYGNTTIPLDRLAQYPFSVVILSLGSLPHDVFAWELFCTKLSGLEPDSDLVVVLDEPRNLLVSGTPFSKRSEWAGRMMTGISQKMSLIISADHPSQLAYGVQGVLSSCISLRVRDKYDIAVVSDALGLKVIETGLHSKARWSARESAFLRVMDDDTVLMTRKGSETCQPVRLDEVPPLVRPENEAFTRMISSASAVDDQREGQQGSHALLRRVATRDYDLAKRVLGLLERYEPLTELAVQKFISASEASGTQSDVQGVIAKLENSSMILQGHEQHSGVSYRNFRITMKGRMALRQAEQEATDAG